MTRSQWRMLASVALLGWSMCTGAVVMLAVSEPSWTLTILLLALFSAGPMIIIPWLGLVGDRW